MLSPIVRTVGPRAIFRPLWGFLRVATNGWTGREPLFTAISRVSGGFESSPQRSTSCQNYNVRPVQRALRVSDRSDMSVSYFKPRYQALAGPSRRSSHDVHQLLLRGPELGSPQGADEVIGHVQGQIQQAFPSAVA